MPHRPLHGAGRGNVIAERLDEPHHGSVKRPPRYRNWPSASRRARVTPQQAGLLAYGANRRVKGLRREEVAMLAGVSVDYYTRLERGNLAGASESVLDALALALTWTRRSGRTCSTSRGPRAHLRLPAAARAATGSGPECSGCWMR